ncbi:metalloregulator ArsR/SmtB family transcription factor [Halobacillus rhizosphaerae]|uniref:ArsR/SmtB family transcription factor n=1 Tax=Halobacillus rhizosphaerae TaxID=3064889 RepID=UPI00398AB4FF
MEPIDVFKALSNETRLNILKWLKEPEKHFPKQQAHLPKEVSIKGGVCVGDIQEKAQASQSTVSHYLNMMQRAGLLESVRYGQWTYYRRNEEILHQLAHYLDTEI